MFAKGIACDNEVCRGFSPNYVAALHDSVATSITGISLDPPEHDALFSGKRVDSCDWCGVVSLPLYNVRTFDGDPPEDVELCLSCFGHTGDDVEVLI